VENRFRIMTGIKLGKNRLQINFAISTARNPSGKISLLKHEFPELPYVTLDVPLYAEEAAVAGDIFLKKFNRPLVIDEIQYAPQLLRHIKVEIDKNRQTNGYIH